MSAPGVGSMTLLGVEPAPPREAAKPPMDLGHPRAETGVGQARGTLANHSRRRGARQPRRAEDGTAAFYNPGGLSFGRETSIEVAPTLGLSALSAQGRALGLEDPFGIAIAFAVTVPLEGALKERIRVGFGGYLLPSGLLHLVARAGDTPLFPYYDNRTQRLFFATGGAAIARALSTDGGRTFARDALPILVAESAWEKGSVGSPAAVVRDGETLLFYEGGPRAGIGLARVDAAGHAARVGDHPVIAPADVDDPAFWRGVTEVGAPYAVVAGDAVRVYFTARGIEGLDATAGDAALPADANDSIGLMTTRDLARFEAHPGGPVFARVANLRAYLGEREAAVRLVEGGPAEIVFVATDSAGKIVSGLARAPE